MTNLVCLWKKDCSNVYLQIQYKPDSNTYICQLKKKKLIKKHAFLDIHFIIDEQFSFLISPISQF